MSSPPGRYLYHCAECSNFRVQVSWAVCQFCQRQWSSCAENVRGDDPVPWSVTTKATKATVEKSMTWKMFKALRKGAKDSKFTSKKVNAVKKVEGKQSRLAGFLTAQQKAVCGLIAPRCDSPMLGALMADIKRELELPAPLSEHVEIVGIAAQVLGMAMSGTLEQQARMILEQITLAAPPQF